MGRNGESGAFGLAAARGGVKLGVGARFARFGNGTGTSNVASEPHARAAGSEFCKLDNMLGKPSRQASKCMRFCSAPR